MATVLSIVYWLLVVAIAVVMFPVAVLVWAITAPLDRRGLVLHALTNVWAGLYTWINPAWSVRVRGREHIERGRVYVMVANHLSLVDVFAVHRLHRHFKWVSKIENFSLPFIGWNMRLNGYVPLRRGDRESVVEMFARCRQVLAQGSSVMMFPEGTRSKTGVMKEWKLGAFELAKAVGVSVLPIAIQGTFTALPAKGLRIGAARMRVTVLPAIGVDEVRAMTAEALRDRARERVAGLLGERAPRVNRPPRARDVARPPEHGVIRSAMLDDAHMALLPPRAVVDELRVLAEQDSSISALAHTPPGSPDAAAIVTLHDDAGEVAFQMVQVPVPGAAGRLFVGQLPGRVTTVRGELDALVAFGIRHVFGLVPRIDLASPYRVPTYVEEASARFGERLRMLDVIDYEAPPDDAAFEAAVEDANRALDAGESVYVHCGAGCGRAGVFVACLLVRRGMEALEAIRRYRSARGCGPETPEQVAYVVRYGRRRPG